MKFDLDRIYNLAQMLKNNGCEVCFVEKDPNRSYWLKEHLGSNVVPK